jgi:sugar lactone lactonase YvrE
MADRTWETLVEGGRYFEGPRWHDGRWWVSDFYDHTVTTVTTDGRREVVVEVAGQPSGLGWRPDGSLIISSMKDRRVLRRTPDGEVTEVADLSSVPEVTGHLNDLIVDDSGRTYVGNFGFDLMAGDTPRTTVLVRVDQDGTTTVAADDLAFPNGTVITPDGTLVVGETMGARFTAFDVQEGGTLTNRRTWADAPEASPDGCTLDAEGCIWASDALGNRLIRVAEGRGIVDEIAVPDGLGTYACMLGGDDGRTLLVCAAPDFYEHARSTTTEAVLLTTRVEAPHAGLP